MRTCGTMRHHDGVIILSHSHASLLTVATAVGGCNKGGDPGREGFFSKGNEVVVECARLTGASAAGESPAGRRRQATTSTPSHGPPFARMEVKR